MVSCSIERNDYYKAAQDAQKARENKARVMQDAIKTDAMFTRVLGNGGIKNAAETLHAALRGSYRDIKNAGKSVQSQWHARAEQYATAFQHELRQMNITKAFNSGLMDKDTYDAMYKLQNGKKIGNAPHEKLARITVQALDKARDNVNAAGGNIRDALNYAIETSHDTEKMRASAGDSTKPIGEAFDAWWGNVQKWISPKTFEGSVPLNGESVAAMQSRIARDIFDGIYTGVHFKVGSVESGFMPNEYGNTINVSNKISARRALIWKDGESAYNYAQAYGKHPNLATTVASIFDRSARSEAVMKDFGSNPMATLNKVMNRVQEEFKSDGDLVKEFQGTMDSIRNEMAVLDGSANIPGDLGIISKIGGGYLRTAEHLIHTGGMAITHLFSGVYSIPNMGAHMGINRLDAFGALTSSVFKGVPEGEMAKIAAENMAYGDGMYRHTHNLSGEDMIPGKISAISEAYSNATGIHMLFDRWKAGIKSMISSHFASNIANKFDDLEPHIKNTLSRYGIDANEWGLIQKTEGSLREYEGAKYLTPQSIKDGLTDAHIKEHFQSKGMIKDSLRDDIASKEKAVIDAQNKFAEISKLAEGAKDDSKARKRLSEIGQTYAVKDTSLRLEGEPKASNFSDIRDALMAEKLKQRAEQEVKNTTESLQQKKELLDARNNTKEKTPDIQHALDTYERYDKSINDKSINQFRNDISDKIACLYSDAAREGVVTAGVKEQAIMTGGSKVGTNANELRKFFWQFKSWPLAAYNQILERNIYQSLSKKEAAYNIGILLSVGVVSGYSRMALTNMLAGKPPPDPRKISTLLEAAGSSGALGIAGDALFGQIKRMSTSGAMATLAGPVVSDVNDLTKIYGKAMGYIEGDKEKIWPQLASFGVNHIPFANIFYIKGAFDYLIAYHLLEAANPGWWERTNQRQQKETGNTMIGYVPGGKVPYGVPGLYLSNGNASSGVLGNGKLK